jgi:FkbM family methyltransferase
MKFFKEYFQIQNFIFNHPLAKRHKLKAFSNFFLWQASQFLWPHEREIPFIMNTKLISKKGLTGVTGNIYTGLHDFEDMGFLIHFLRKSDLFFDIGANIGTYTILASGVTGASSVSFEPVPKTFNYLKRNIAINNLQDLVRLRNIGLSKGPDKLFFTINYDTVNHVTNRSEYNEENYILVDVDCFNNIIKIEGVPILVKIDVEGFETEVLRGMDLLSTSNTLKAIIIELNGSGSRYGFDDTKVHHHLIESGYHPFKYNPFDRKLTPSTSFGSINTIYINDVDFVKMRLETSDSFQVFSENI